MGLRGRQGSARTPTADQRLVEIVDELHREMGAVLKTLEAQLIRIGQLQPQTEEVRTLAKKGGQRTP